MATPEELLKNDCIAVANEFRADGSLVDFKANLEMSPELAAMSAQFCATVSMLSGNVSGAFTQLSGMSWSPPKGWMFSGGDWTVAVGGKKGAFVESARADFNKLYGALVGGG